MQLPYNYSNQYNTRTQKKYIIILAITVARCQWTPNTHKCLQQYNNAVHDNNWTNLMNYRPEGLGEVVTGGRTVMNGRETR